MWISFLIGQFLKFYLDEQKLKSIVSTKWCAICDDDFIDDQLELLIRFSKIWVLRMWLLFIAYLLSRQPLHLLSQYISIKEELLFNWFPFSSSEHLMTSTISVIELKWFWSQLRKQRKLQGVGSFGI